MDINFISYKKIICTKQQWLNQIVLFDKWGRPPSLADVPLTYGARKKAFKLMKYSDEKITIPG